MDKGKTTNLSTDPQLFFFLLLDAKRKRESLACHINPVYWATSLGTIKSWLSLAEIISRLISTQYG